MNRRPETGILPPAATAARGIVHLRRGYRQAVQTLDQRLAEISRFSRPEPEVRWLVLAAAATALGSREVTLHVLRRIREAGVGTGPVREAILQTYLFAGYPRAINALAELAALWGDDPPPGAELDLVADLDRQEDWIRDGAALCETVYGPGYRKLLELMARLSPELGRWMIVEGYGKVLSRPELDPRARELTAVGALLMLHVPAQLRAHLRGALHVGATAEDVRGTIAAAAVLAPETEPFAIDLLESLLRREARSSPQTGGS